MDAAIDIGLSDYMDDSTPGENKRLPSPDIPPTPADDLQIFIRIIKAIDRKLPTSDTDTGQELTRNKNYLLSLKNDVVSIYNKTFHQTSDWKLTKQKKSKL